MGIRRTDAFRKDAARIALTSVLTRRQFSDDIGFGLSTLNKLVTVHRATDMISSVDRELAEENERLRRDNRILKEERDIQKADRGVEGYSHFVTAARWVGTFPSREFSEVCALAGYEADFLHPQFRRLVQKAERDLQEKRTPRVMAAE